MFLSHAISHLLASLLLAFSLTTCNSFLSLSLLFSPFYFYSPPPFCLFVYLRVPSSLFHSLLFCSKLIGNGFHIPVSGLQNSFFSAAGCDRFPAKDSLVKGTAHFLSVIFALQKFLKPFPVSFLIACSCELSEEEQSVTKRSFSLISGGDICCSLSPAHLVFVLDVLWLLKHFFPIIDLSVSHCSR